MGKCKLCPTKNHCRDECYGDNPCAFALAFDKLARKLDRKEVCIESLKAENARLEKDRDYWQTEAKEAREDLDASTREAYDLGKAAVMAADMRVGGYQPTETTKTAPPDRGSGVQKYLSTAEREPIVSKATYERVQRAIQERKTANPSVVIPPLGYKWENGQMVEVEEEAEIVRRATEEMNSDGQISDETAEKLRCLWELHYKVPKEYRPRAACDPADRSMARIVAKSAMKAHEEWKADHPRPERATKKEMAQYIERELAIKAAVGALRGVSHVVGVDVAQALEDLPAADVVPRHPLEKL